MTPAACPCCGSRGVRAHRAPHEARSMLSSGRVIAAPLMRATCLACGHGFHAPPLPAEEIAGFYAGDYAVRFGDTGTEDARVRAVADLLARAVADRPAPRRILEIGCGAGATLALAGTRFAGAVTHGLEPAPRMAAAARARGATVTEGLLDAYDGPGGFDLVYAVNVLEHVPDPAAALARIRALLAPGGVCVQITPDGERPGVELLFRDHVSSFTRASLARFGRAAGLCLAASEALDGPLLEFRLSRLAADGAWAAPLPETDGARLAAARERFLSRAGRRPDGLAAPWLIFGTGEMTSLLAAYAPEVTEGAAGYVLDRPQAPAHLGRPVHPLDALAPGQRILVAVHARSAAAVAARLAAAGHRPILLDWEGGQP